MGEWSEAMGEGIICPRCFCLTADEEGNRISCTCPAPALETIALEARSSAAVRAPDACQRSAGERATWNGAPVRA